MSVKRRKIQSDGHATLPLASLGEQHDAQLMLEYRSDLPEHVSMAVRRVTGELVDVNFRIGPPICR
jgi:hypothetical protein